MYVPDIELHEARSVNDAAELLTRYAPDVKLLAGGTDLLVDLKTGRIATKHLVSIRNVREMRGVSMEGDVLRIGARTTITELSRSSIVRDRFAPLLDATRDMAAQQIRNIATVGGNLASAVSCADLPPILIVMQASVVLVSPNGQRTVPLEEFFAGVRRTVATNTEILTEILVPIPPERSGAAYARFALRDGNAIAVASVAAGIRFDEYGLISDARVVLGAVAPNPVMVDAAAETLRGSPPTDDAYERAAVAATEAARPISDIRGSAEFRRELVGVLTKRALTTARQRAEERS